jgi:DNA mismatch repair protein MutS
LEKKLFSNIEIKEVLEKKYWLNIYYFENSKNTKQMLCKHFWVKNLIWYWIENKDSSIEAAALLLSYLSNNQKTDLKFLQKVSYTSFDYFMNLDESTIYSLDLLYNLSTKSSTLWTLVWVLNKTKTSAWNRMIRDQIVKPLQSVQEINSRNTFVSEFYSNKILLDQVREELWYVADIDSILNRIALNRTNPRDLLNLKRSLQSILNVVEVINKNWSKKLKEIINI